MSMISLSYQTPHGGAITPCKSLQACSVSSFSVQSAVHAFRCITGRNIQKCIHFETYCGAEYTRQKCLFLQKPITTENECNLNMNPILMTASGVKCGEMSKKLILRMCFSRPKWSLLQASFDPRALYLTPKQQTDSGFLKVWEDDGLWQYSCPPHTLRSTDVNCTAI